MVLIFFGIQLIDTKLPTTFSITLTYISVILSHMAVILTKTISDYQ